MAFLHFKQKGQSKQQAMVIVSYAMSSVTYIQWLKYYYIVNNVFVLLSRVTYPCVRQNDCIFSYIIMTVEE